MALRYAVQNGNWSNTATWDGGTLPGNGDDVYTDGKIVTIDIDLVGQYRPVSLRARSRGSGGTAGGQFVVNTTRQIGEPGYPVYLYGPDVSGQCIQHSGASTTLTVYGEVIGGFAGEAHGIRNASSGTVTVTGNVTGGSASSAFGINNGSTGTVTVTGNVSGGSAGAAYAINNASTGTVTINGDVRPTATNQVANAVLNNSTGYITINGDVYGGRGATAVYANAGYIRINGDLRWDETYSSAAAVGTSLNGLIVLNGKIRHHYGTTGFYGHTLCTGRVLLYNGKTSLTEYAESATGGMAVTGNPIYHYGELLAGFNHPSEPDVRFGVTYGPDNQYTGSCRVPSPQSVAYGVPVDNTTGTAFIDISEIIAGTGVIVSDSNNAAATFKTNLSGAKTKFVGMFLRFKTGSLSGEIREIVDFDETTKFVTVNKSFSAIPSAGDSFTLIGYSGR